MFRGSTQNATSIGIFRYPTRGNANQSLQASSNLLLPLQGMEILRYIRPPKDVDLPILSPRSP